MMPRLRRISPTWGRGLSLILLGLALVAASLFGAGLIKAGATPNKASERGYRAELVQKSETRRSTHRRTAKRKDVTGNSSGTSCTSWCTPRNQEFLDPAADDARSIAGAAYYTGCIVNDPHNKDTLYLASAPQSVIDQLNAAHPGVYVIHNDAPRSRSAVLSLLDSLDLSALKSEGIDVLAWGATEDGYARIGVSGDVATAQRKFDAQYGPNVVQVYKSQVFVVAPYHGG